MLDRRDVLLPKRSDRARKQGCQMQNEKDDIFIQTLYFK